MAPLREEGVAAGRETVNKVCGESKLCSRQHSRLVSPSLPPSASPRRIKKRKRGVFRKQTGASAWIQLDWEMIVQTALRYLAAVRVRRGSGAGSRESWKQTLQKVMHEIWNICRGFCRFLGDFEFMCDHTCREVYTECICRVCGILGQVNIYFFRSLRDTNCIYCPNWLWQWKCICFFCH